MKPSNFLRHPYNSIIKKWEAEIIARNIMVILSRTGNNFKVMSWDEYKEHRIKDGDFSKGELHYFDKVVDHCSCLEKVVLFSPVWANVSANNNI